MKFKWSYASDYGCDRYKDIEINTIEELIKFMDDHKDDIIISRISEHEANNSLMNEDDPVKIEGDLYLTIYNGYIE